MTGCKLTSGSWRQRRAEERQGLPLWCCPGQPFDFHACISTYVTSTIQLNEHSRLPAACPHALPPPFAAAARRAQRVGGGRQGRFGRREACLLVYIDSCRLPESQKPSGCELPRISRKSGSPEVKAGLSGGRGEADLGADIGGKPTACALHLPCCLSAAAAAAAAATAAHKRRVLAHR